MKRENKKLQGCWYGHRGRDDTQSFRGIGDDVFQEGHVWDNLTSLARRSIQCLQVQQHHGKLRGSIKHGRHQARVGKAQNNITAVITLCLMGSGYHQIAWGGLPAVCPCCSQVILKGEIQQEPHGLEGQSTFRLAFSFGSWLGRL